MVEQHLSSYYVTFVSFSLINYACKLIMHICMRLIYAFIIIIHAELSLLSPEHQIAIVSLGFWLFCVQIFAYIINYSDVSQSMLLNAKKNWETKTKIQILCNKIGKWNLGSVITCVIFDFGRQDHIWTVIIQERNKQAGETPGVTSEIYVICIL